MSDDKKQVLVVYYSQTGQLRDVVDAVVDPLRNDPDVSVTTEVLRPKPPYPFPWSVRAFADVLPESVLLIPPELESFDFDPGAAYDLVILAYQPWYLSPSPPMTGFLASPEAAQVLNGRPVVTLVGCRGMWLMAQEVVKQRLAELDADLIDNAVLTDRGSGPASMITTPRWMLSGKRDRFLGIFPPPGIAPGLIEAASRFGQAIRDAVSAGGWERREPLLQGLGAVKVEPHIIDVEKITRRLFRFWSTLARAAGKPGGGLRALVLVGFGIWLVLSAILVLPIGVLVRLLLQPFMRAKLARDVAYFEAPSGSDTSRIN